MVQNTGKIIVITAPSGAGKTTIARRILSESDKITFSVSATTRKPRKHEIHGKDYYFLTEDEFQKNIDEGKFLEWEEFYGGIRYGTLRSVIENHLNNGYFVLFDVDVKGAVNLKNIYGNRCLSLFIQPPSFETLESRLKGRGSENKESLRVRLERARMELTMASHFDHVVLNDQFEVAYGEVKRIVQAFIDNP